MVEVNIKDIPFRSARRDPQTKADITNTAARSIIKAEADSREAKIERLKRARLEMEAQQPAPAPTKGRAKKPR